MALTHQFATSFNDDIDCIPAENTKVPASVASDPEVSVVTCRDEVTKAESSPGDFKLVGIDDDMQTEENQVGILNKLLEVLDMQLKRHAMLQETKKPSSFNKDDDTNRCESGSTYTLVSLLIIISSHVMLPH